MNVWLESRKLYMHAKCKANDFTEELAWQLLLIKSSHTGINLSECCDSHSNTFYWMSVVLLLRGQKYLFIYKKLYTKLFIFFSRTLKEQKEI